MITVLTPTYNRAHTLPRLYSSLCEQTCYDFEWFIIDDGSIDNTKELIQNYQSSSPPFLIHYVFQKNSGKAMAINRAVNLIQNDFVYFMDSDDYLPVDSIAQLYPYLEEIKNDFRFCGITGLRVDTSGVPIGSYIPHLTLDIDSLSFRIKYKALGDYAGVIKTSVLREFPFPMFKDEKFCTEALILNRIAKKYITRYINCPLRVTEYLPGGLTDTYEKIMLASPNGSLLYFKELFYSKISLRTKLSLILSYQKIYKKCNKHELDYIVKPTYAMHLLYPVSLLLYKLYTMKKKVLC
mgnify:CR=1 FL=1